MNTDLNTKRTGARYVAIIDKYVLSFAVKLSLNKRIKPPVPFPIIEKGADITVSFVRKTQLSLAVSKLALSSGCLTTEMALFLKMLPINVFSKGRTYWKLSVGNISWSCVGGVNIRRHFFQLMSFAICSIVEL